MGRDRPRRGTSGKPSSNNKHKKSTAFQKLYSFTPAARTPRPFIQFFREKGMLPPFPRHFTSAYCRDLAGSARTGNRGLGSPHSADHTETLTPPIVRQDKRFAFGSIHKSSLGLFISLDLELSRWRIGRGGVPARLRLHFHGWAVSHRRGEVDLTHSPYTIPGCTYAPISITPGAGLPYERLSLLPAGPAGDPRAGAVRSSLSHRQYRPFRPGCQGPKPAPSALAEGRFSLLPVWFIIAPIDIFLYCLEPWTLCASQGSLFVFEFLFASSKTNFRIQFEIKN